MRDDNFLNCDIITAKRLLYRVYAASGGMR
jgi:hypothetical protein